MKGKNEMGMGPGGIDPGGPEDDGDYGYSTGYPGKYGGFHRTIFDRNYGDRFSYDTDPDDDYADGSGHYTDPLGGHTPFDPGF